MQKWFLLFIVMFFLFCGATAWSQKEAVSLSGKLLMLDDLTPHVAVPVQAILPGSADPRGRPQVIATTLSDENGKYRFINLKPGRYQVRCYTLRGYIYYGEGKDKLVEVSHVEQSEIPHSGATSQQIQRGKNLKNIDFRFAPFKKGTWRKYDPLDGLAPNVVYGIYRAADGVMWLTIPSGVARYDGRKFVNFAEKDGLADNDEVTAIHGDPDGVMWFGTKGGVSRYDGKGFVNFTVKNGLAHNNVRDIYVDPDGVMWFGTDGGVSRYDGKESKFSSQFRFSDENKFVNFTVKNGLAHNNVRDIYGAPDGVMWFATADGVSRYDGKKFVNFTTEDGLVHNDVRGIYGGQDGVIWFRTDNGVSRYDGKEFVSFTEKDGLVSNQVWTIHDGPDGVMWFGTKYGVSRYDGKEFVSFTEKDELPGGQVRAIHRDADGVMWFATVGGVSRYDGKGFVTFTTADGLANNWVNAIHSDTDGVMWFATGHTAMFARGGLSRYDSKGFVNFTTKDGLAHNQVWMGHGDPDGMLWFGTPGGVSRYEKPSTSTLASIRPSATLRDGMEFVNLTEEDGLADNRVSYIHRAPDGMLWFGTWGGASRYEKPSASRGFASIRPSASLRDGGEFVNFTTRDGLGDNLVTSIDTGPGGVLWLGMWFGDGGVSRYDGVEFVNFTTEDGLAGRFISVVHRGRDDMMWFGTELSGISRYDGKEFINFTTDDGLASNQVWAIHDEPDGVMWFGTSGGLSRYDGEEFVNFTTEDGLATDQIGRDIYHDSHGNMWVGTDGGGVSWYDGIAWTSLDTRDGLAGNTITWIHQDSDGYLWFATGEGITRYRRDTVLPKVYIASVTTDQTYSDLSAIPAFTPGTRITIEYNAIDFKTVPEKRQYRYRIKEIDRDWRRPTKATSFDYTFKKAGAYTFEVQAIDRDLNYSQPASVTFFVVPPFYMQAGFLIPTVSLGTILLAALTVSLIVLVKHRRQVRAYERAAVQELQDAREMQMALLPKTAPSVEKLEVAGECIPANTVGGDFYDYVPLGGDIPAIVLADVSGKGMKAAMYAVLSSGVLHAEAKESVSPSQMLQILNEDLKARVKERMNCAMCIATIDLNNRILRYSNAGIPYPIVKRKGEIFELKCNGMPLGGFLKFDYEDVELELQSGDVVVFFSDGVTECLSKENPEQFYDETGRLFSVIGGFEKDMNAQAMIQAILADLRDFASNNAQSDDITIVVVKVKKIENEKTGKRDMN